MSSPQILDRSEEGLSHRGGESGIAGESRTGLSAAVIGSGFGGRSTAAQNRPGCINICIFMVIYSGGKY